MNGVTAEQRSALVPGLPPLVFSDCQGGRSQSAEGAGRSSMNKTEAQLVVQLVLALLNCRARPTQQQKEHQQQQQQGVHVEEASSCCSSDEDEGEEQKEDAAAVQPHQLGVICFFRGQAMLIRQLLIAGEHGTEHLSRNFTC